LVKYIDLFCYISYHQNTPDYTIRSNTSEITTEEKLRFLIYTFLKQLAATATRYCQDVNIFSALMRDVSDNSVLKWTTDYWDQQVLIVC